MVIDVPGFDDAGRSNGGYAMKTEVTSVRRAEERLCCVMASSPLAMSIRDIDGRVA